MQRNLCVTGFNADHTRLPELHALPLFRPAGRRRSAFAVVIAFFSIKRLCADLIAP